MKIATIAVSFILAGACFAANAATLDNIAVYSTVKENGSASIGETHFYTKSFEVTLGKLAGKDVNLSKLCLKAYSPDNKEFKLDTIDEKLAKGTLKDGKIVRGIAVFSSDDTTVFQAALVKISDDCK